MGGRRIATIFLVVLGCVLALLSSIAVWLRALVLDTHSYVKAVAPILDDAEVRNALADTIVGELYAHVDVAGELRKALPKQADTFAPTIAASIRATSVQLAADALGTKAVRRVWKNANRVAHEQLVHVLVGNGHVVSTRNGDVAIATGALAGEVRRALDDAGIHVFDNVDTAGIDQRFVLFHSTDLQHAQQATRILDDAGTWLPIITIGVFVAAFLCAPHRRRAVEWAAIGLALAMVVIVVGIAVGRVYYLDAVGDAIARPVAAAPFDALVVPLRAGVRIVFVLAILTWTVVWITGAHVVLEREEHARAVAIAAIRRHARALAIGGALAAAVTLVAWDRPRLLTVAGIVGLLTLWEIVVLASVRSARLPT